MTHFSRACVSPYISILTMSTVSRIVSEIFSVKEWRYLKILVRDRRSRSPKLVPFEILGTVSYSHSIVAYLWLVSFPR